MTNFEVSVLFFAQVVAILATCRVVGLLAARLGQPQVVGEMIAGVLLGPSLLGLLLPNVQAQLFPAQSKTVIYAVAQVGLVLYMFVIGLEFDVGLIRRRLRTAGTVSAAGIVAPFGLGCAIALLLVGNDQFFGPEVPAWQGMLFLGAATSITAFPMLARIIHERGLAGTSLGTLALAAGSIDDAVAWCVLALVVASFKADPLIALMAIGGGGLYVAGMLLGGRRLLKPLAAHVERQGGLSGPVLSGVLMLLMLAAWTTDSLGIYAVFGAFVFGAAVPRGLLARELIHKIEPVAASFLLPLFFVYSGLSTQVGLIDQSYLWGLALLIVAAAVAGKAGACWLAARANGETQAVALGVGSLMNARGLMELIALNIGLEHKIVSPTLFTIMVLMAIVTTLMASPMFELVRRHAGERRRSEARTGLAAAAATSPTAAR
jgi:Kef-type K+ transport system membrane component KefB